MKDVEKSEISPHLACYIRYGDVPVEGRDTREVLLASLSDIGVPVVAVGGAHLVLLEQLG